MLRINSHIGPFRRVQLVKNLKLVEANSHWLPVLENLTTEIQKSNDPKKRNYLIARLDLHRHLTFDLLVEGTSIVSFCGIYSGGRYPEGTYRVLNRCFVNPLYRTRTLGSFANLNSQFLLKEQLNEFKNNIELPFISREGRMGFNFLCFWAKKCAPTPGWIVSDTMVHVVPESFDSPAYQHICYPGEKHHLFTRIPSISKIEWTQRFNV
jgi:hypothetical protein